MVRHTVRRVRVRARYFEIGEERKKLGDCARRRGGGGGGAGRGVESVFLLVAAAHTLANFFSGGERRLRTEEKRGLEKVRWVPRFVVLEGKPRKETSSGNREIAIDSTVLFCSVLFSHINQVGRRVAKRATGQGRATARDCH